MSQTRFILQNCRLGFFLKTYRLNNNIIAMDSDHVQRTADNSRTELISLARVIRLQDVSKTVKSLTLQIENRNLSFKAGQWLDMFIPGLKTVGGFSMYSSPCKLSSYQQLDLAVKYSEHPPAYWVHTQCKLDSQVHVRVGGDFYFDLASENNNDLLLIAGGVGINPLCSILNHVADLSAENQTNDKFLGRVKILYSASSLDELIFKEHIEGMHSNIRSQFFVTREGKTEKLNSRILGKK